MGLPKTFIQLQFSSTLVAILLLFNASAQQFPHRVWTEDGKLHTSMGPYFIKGVCYHPVAIGETDRSFSRLNEDLALMIEMGVNTIRVYEPIESEEVLNEIHAAGIKVILGFGYNQNGKYDLLSNTYLDYVKRFKEHPAILFWELGNEYNYHPEWFGGSIDEWYKTLEGAIESLHALDPNHPVSTAHGEVPESELIHRLEALDLWGLNVYRWDESQTALDDFASQTDKPVYFSELGADSFMTESNAGFEEGENQKAQAMALYTILSKIKMNDHPPVGVAVFSFTDGWWKAGNPQQQDIGGWAPGSSGVPYDGTANEEYWGLLDIDRNRKEAFWTAKMFFEQIDWND
ncbi:MAG: hypothetical protein ACO2XQ_06875 [Flavobacteriales bacterium]